MKQAGERLPERRAVSRDPAAEARRAAARGAVHHVLRVLLLLGVAAGIYALFPGAQTAGVPVLEKGVVAREEVIARVGFDVPKAPGELEREQEEAARGVPPVYELRPGAADSVLAGVAAFFASVDRAAGGAVLGGDATPALRQALERARVPTTLGGLQVLADPVRRQGLRAATEDAVRAYVPRGIAAASPAASGISAVRIRGMAAGERLLASDSVLTADQFYRAAQQRIPASLGADAAELQRLVLVRYFRPSLAENPALTAAARARAAAAVDSVKERILPGQRIVGAREPVGEREVERLRAYQAAMQGQESEGGAHGVPRALGSVMFNALLLMIVGAMLLIVRPRIYHDDRSVLFMGLLILSVAGIAAPIARFDLPAELIPIPFATLMAAILWGGRLALVLALVLSLVLGGQQPFIGLTVPFEAALAGAAAAFGLRMAQRRFQAWGLVLVIAAAYAGAVLSAGLMRARGADEIAWGMLWGAVNAVGSTLLAMGVLPLAEWFTRVTTNQTLMELADPKHPLLQRLSLEAPGTYAHTISVANLAEAVCNAIGANALLARVGVYYHDVGKITKPLYFIENQPRGRNPHDRLKPSMSAAVVRSHVVEGLRLAGEYRLPQAVKDFIAQHHGTQSISFFMEQARRADPDARLNPADFSYGGPRPQTRETAVVMIADSCESAARVLADPSPERIRELVDRIVDAKIAAGQLDECPLTLREITVAKDVLAKVLSGMYHQRLDYPASRAPAPATNAGGGEAPGPAEVARG